VRIVDEDRRAAAQTDQLEPAFGALQVFERREHRSRIAAGGNGEAGGDQRIFDLKLADQRQMHRKSLPPCSSRNACEKPSMNGFDETDAGSVTADAHDRQAARFGGGHDRVRMLVVDIDDRSMPPGARRAANSRSLAAR
jgi:hypothetical protein